MGPSDVIVSICDLEIDVRAPSIVTDDDLAYDFNDRSIWPFDPKKDNSIHWQCIPVKNARATFRSWILENGHFSNKRERLCASEIQVRDRGQLQKFAIMHAQSMNSCHEFSKSFDKLVMGQKIICLNADMGVEEFNDHGEHYRLWGLEKYKTRLGCDSYFYGKCATRGCAKGKCEAVSKY
jgi:hypothetical protein